MIRIMTYNIRGGLGMDNKRSIPRIADVIRASGAQIVCLQEVHQRLPWSKLTDQPRWLGERLGMRFVLQRNVSFGAGGFGNALLTKYDILETRSHSLTSKKEQRGLLEVSLATPEGPLTIFCTHLGLDGEERVRQAMEIAEILRAKENPYILCGDFNEESHQPAVTSLLANSELIDVASSGGAPTFDSVTQDKRIDLILCHPSVNAADVSIIESEASDHLPVVADVFVRNADTTRNYREKSGQSGNDSPGIV